MARDKTKEQLDAPPVLLSSKKKSPQFPDAQAFLTGDDLSELARSFWAKSGRENPYLWLPVHQHLMDAADVAGRIFDHYLSHSLREFLASVWDGNQTTARKTLVFLAGVHDVGKVTVNFCSQQRGLAQFVRDHGIDVPTAREIQGRTDLPHGFASQFALVEAMCAGGGDKSRAQEWAPIVGVHHGRYPSASILKIAHDFYTGGMGSKGDEPKWHEARQELISWMAKRSGFPLEDCEGTALPALPIAVAAAYAATVVMADWIASNEDWFPLLRVEDRFQPLDAEFQAARSEAGWNRARMPRPMLISSQMELPADDFYRSRFTWGAEITPTRTQIRAVEIARETPDLMIVEAPPGSGKTELAFAAAEILMRKRGLQGVVVALPTQATTNAMFTRTQSWLSALIRDRDRVLDVFLAHGKNDLNEDFVKLLDKGRRPIQVFDEDDEARASDRQVGLVANAWMAGRWRTMLSPVVVGTIDQVLLAALRSRHVLMRHLGLAGKVVIIDEVHAADTYMETYLEAALTWLGMYGVPVVLLSATLPSDRRLALVDAYRRGRGGSTVSDVPLLEGDIGYPLITTVGTGGGKVRTEVTAGNEAHVVKRIQPLDGDDPEQIAKLLTPLVDQGACAVVIRNTVREAQATFATLRQHFGPNKVTLSHSRFLACDRVRNDQRLLELFGKRGNRPRGHIVVSTQVIEQSLDVDFDVMVTDPAPMDLVLQRIGRLHRHAGRERPEGTQEALCHVLVGNQTVQPWTYGTGNDVVYGAHKVLRFLGILADHPDGIVVDATEDYSALTQLAYSEKAVGPNEWSEALAEAKEEARKTDNQSIITAKEWCLDSSGMTEWRGDALVAHLEGNASTGDGGNKGGIHGRAAVRDSEDQIPVLIVPVDPALGGVPIRLPWLNEDNGLAVPIDPATMPSAELVREVRSWSLTLPPWQFKRKGESLEDTIDAVVGALWDHEATREWCWLEHPLLRGELVLPMWRVDEFSPRLEAKLRDRRIVYTSEGGLEVQDL